METGSGVSVASHRLSQATDGNGIRRGTLIAKWIRNTGWIAIGIAIATCPLCASLKEYMSFMQIVVM